jgi:hypothetical protein
MQDAVELAARYDPDVLARRSSSRAETCPVLGTGARRARCR